MPTIVLVVAHHLLPLQHINCSHSNLITALSLIPGAVANTTPEAATDAFVQTTLLPTANIVGRDGWDMGRVLRQVQDSAHATGDAHTQEVVQQLQTLIEGAERVPSGRRVLNARKPEEREAFRIHPKVCCCKVCGWSMLFVGGCMLNLERDWCGNGHV